MSYIKLTYKQPFTYLIFNFSSLYIGQLLEQLLQLHPPLDDFLTDLYIIYKANVIIPNVISISIKTPSLLY